MTERITARDLERLDRQLEQINRIVRSATNRGIEEITPPSRDRLKKLIENGDEFYKLIVAGIHDLSLPDEFADEEIFSDSTYPEQYKGAKPIVDQINMIAKIFALDPTQTFEYVKNLRWAKGWFGEGPTALNDIFGVSQPELPSKAEGLFAIPQWRIIAPSYNEAVQIVLTKLSQASDNRFRNWLRGKLGSKNLRQTTKTTEAFQRLADQQQDNNILIVAAQFGLWHRGRSVRRTHEIMTMNEFGLDTFSVGIMLLTHPERLDKLEYLAIDCAGDEYAPEGNDVFSKILCFWGNYDDPDDPDCCINLEHDMSDVAEAEHGSASGFLPRY
jgi:hypothetical protein